MYPGANADTASEKCSAANQKLSDILKNKNICF